MSYIKEYYLNNLTEEELNKLAEEYYFHQESLYEIKETSTFPPKEDKDIHQTYPYDN